MKQDLLKQENVKLKKKIRGLTFEIDCLESEIKYKDESLSYYIESNQLALELLTQYQNRGNKKAGGYKLEDVNRWLDQLRLFCSQEDKEYTAPVKIEYIIDYINGFVIDDLRFKSDKELRNVKNFYNKIKIEESYPDIEKMFIEGRNNDAIILFLINKKHLIVRM